MNSDLFDSCVRARGDLAGVVEGDEGSLFFYLYDLERASDEKVVAAIGVALGGEAPKGEDFSIRWNPSDSVVGLFYRGDICAAFGEDGKKYGEPASLVPTSWSGPAEVSSGFLVRGSQ